MSSPGAICDACQLSPGFCGCTCSTPPLSLCSSCLEPHLASPGSHIIEPLSVAEPPPLPTPISMNEFCSLCMNEAPEAVCCCEEAGLVLCRGCIAAHNAKNQDRMHIILPLKARSHVSCPGYLERLTKRQRSLNEGMKELRANLKRIDKCEKGLVLRVEKLIKEVSEYRDVTLRRLSEYRASLEQKLSETRAEIEGHIYEDTYLPCDPVAKVIWDYAPGKLNLFSFTEKGEYKVDFQAKLEPKEPAPAKPAPAPKASLPAQSQPPAVTSQQLPQAPKPQATASQIPPKPLVAVSKPSLQPQGSQVPVLAQSLFCLNPGTLSFFNPSSGKFSHKVTLTPANLIVQTASACVLSDGQILACGQKKPLSSSAYIIDPATGRVSKVRDMLYPRFGHGMVTYHSLTFAFGGSSKSGILSSSEQFSIVSKNWAQVRNMLTPRSQFNPCLWGDFIYLLGGTNTVNCEVYDVLNDEFVPLTICVQILCQTAAVLAPDNTIVVVQNGNVAKWRIGDDHFEVSSKSGPKKAWGNANPVVVGNKVYIPMFGSMAVKEVAIPA